MFRKLRVCWHSAWQEQLEPDLRRGVPCKEPGQLLCGLPEAKSLYQLDLVARLCD